MNRILKSIPQAFYVIGVVMLVVVIVLTTYIYSYIEGYNKGATEIQSEIEQILRTHDIYVSSLSENESLQTEVVRETVYVTPQPRQTPNWTGPELFEAVNKRRIELGVNPLANETSLCTVASLRLNELLELGKLDAHEGFIALSKRDDYQYIFQKYNVYEFLLSGADSAEEAVSLWENTQGHSKLLTGGEYVWGCTYAQNGFGVAITAF